jgi:excisionase family DNA binding protein
VELATSQPSQVLSPFGWPPLLPTRLACTYCSTSRRTLLRAVDAGDLSPVSKRGRSLIFDRSDLDAWMRATTVEPAVAPRRYRARTERRDVGAALDKLRRIARA